MQKTSVKRVILFLVALLCATVGFNIITLQERKALNYEYGVLRKKYGALSCKCNGIGPTGGFCLDKDKIHVGGNQLWSKNLTKELRKLFHKQSVYDFGAGLGWYGKALVANETDGYHVTNYKAFDGAENINVVFPGGFVEYLDLSQPVYLPPKDWVLSLEVGEHIPAKYEKIFIQNLHRHNKKGIVLSWAVEGQDGHFHVNCRNNQYIKTIFQQLGYSNDLSLETRFRNVVELNYLKNTLMIFRKSSN